MSLKLWLFERLPGGARVALANKKIGAWLRKHGASEVFVKGLLSGYKTRLVALAAIVHGLMLVVTGLKAQDQASIGQGGVELAAAIGALGIRFASGWTTFIGSAVAILTPLSGILTGAAHDWDLGAILQAWPQLMLALGLGALHSGVNGDGPNSLKTVRARALARSLNAGAYEARPTKLQRLERGVDMGALGSPLVLVFLAPWMLLIRVVNWVNWGRL